MVAAGKGRGKAACPLIPVPPHSDHLKAYTTSMAKVQQLLPIDLCTNRFPVLATIISVLDTMAADENAVEVDQQMATKVMCYLAECLATLTSLVDPSTPSVNNAFMLDVIP